jgi:hypothetical protein
MDELLKKYENNKKGLTTLIRNNKDLLNELISLTNKLPINISVNQRLYCYKHNIFESPTCLYCGKITKFINFYDGFSPCCSFTCNRKHKKELDPIKYKEDCYQSHLKAVSTKKERGLSEYPLQSQAAKDKASATWAKKSKEEIAVIIDKRMNTFEETHDGQTYSEFRTEFVTEFHKNMSDEQKEQINIKRKQTCKERYGDEYVINSEYSRQKTKDKLRVEYSLQDPTINNKTR